ncbi:MAG: MFS transporter [Pauljensenia sp.]|uniref:MFS transporter n=1 Tax=Actinomyces sp. oral taxon 180 TaxID=651609 RepID=UPI0002D2A5C0|nr:MFS transporter [Actinomyces sp. oral taxon 180]
MPSSPLLTNPTLRALVAIALFTYTAQNMLNVSIAPLSRALSLPEWIVGAAVSLAALAVTVLSQFWGRRSIAWGRRRVILWALGLALAAGTIFSAAVWARAGGAIGAASAAGAIMVARGPFFGSAVAAIPPTGQALVAEVTPDEASRVRGTSAFSGAINLSVMIGSLVSSALGAWWIFAPVHATPLFVLVALGIALAWLPRDGDGSRPARRLPGVARDAGRAGHVRPASSGPRADTSQADAALPPRVGWLDRRIAPWIVSVFGIYFANGVVQITMGFVVQDRGALDPTRAVPVTGVMLLANAAGAMLMQLIVVPRLGWGPRSLLRAGMTAALAALACLSVAPSLWAVGASTFALGVASGMASPGYAAGASLSVSAREQGGIAGIINATGAITWIVAPVSATALYGWAPLSPFLLALALLVLSCACAWWLLARVELRARVSD